MIAIKIDKEKVEKCIESYKEEHGKYPYLIMSERTYKLMPTESSFAINNNGLWCGCTDTIGVIPNNNINLDEMTIKINDNEFVNKNKSGKSYGTWHNAKILIDNSLDYGEIHIG